MLRVLRQRASHSPSTARHSLLAATAAVSSAWAPRRRSLRPCCCQPWRMSRRYPFAPKPHSVACLVQEMCKGKSTCTWMLVVHGTNAIGLCIHTYCMGDCMGGGMSKVQKLVGSMALSPSLLPHCKLVEVCSM